MLTSNNLYNFSSKVLTNYNNILQNPIKFAILYQKDQKTDNIISNRLSVLRRGIYEREIHTV